MTSLSIILCCYNSAPRLPQTLYHIAHQIVPQDIEWEVVLVNNASTDNTCEVAFSEWKKHNCHTPFCIVNQPEPGLSAARKMGIAEAKGRYLLFCDDDNWLSVNYVSLAYQIMEANPEIGVLGGQTEAVYETTPPDWFLKNTGAFAIGKQETTSGSVTHLRGWV